MKDFAANPGRLRVLSVGAKVLYSAFLVAALTGLLISWKLYGVAVGNAGPRAYYSGEVAATGAPTDPAPAPPAGASASDLGGGPSLDLPQEAAVAKPMVEQISDRRLLEVTHFHIFTIPIYVLVLAHLWLLTRLPSWLHTTGIAAAVASSGIHIAGPWMVRGHPSLAFLMPVSAIVMLVVLAGIAIASGIDMWMPRARAMAQNRPSPSPRTQQEGTAGSEQPSHG